MKTQRLLLDTDPGIDDALAILLALASPELDFAALTVTAGNCPLEDGLRNGRDLLALAGAKLPFAGGMDRPLIRAPLFAPETHGRRGLGNADLPISNAQPLAEHAADLIIREVLAAPGEVTLVAVAPLGNVALALRKAPQIAPMLRELIIMGGAFRCEGNVTPLAEFNVYFDPHAAHIVLHSGAPITIMPWDITRDVLMSRADAEKLQALGGPLARFIVDATSFYIDFHEEYFGYAGCSINDPAALALAFQPDLAEYQHVFVDVEICSETTMGKTVADFMRQNGREPNARLVTAFDNQRFHDLFMNRLARSVEVLKR